MGCSNSKATATSQVHTLHYDKVTAASVKSETNMIAPTSNNTSSSQNKNHGAQIVGGHNNNNSNNSSNVAIMPLKDGHQKTEGLTNGDNGESHSFVAAPHRERFASYASGASTPEIGSDEDDTSSGSNRDRRLSGKPPNPKALVHSTSAIGLDEMIEDRREVGDFVQNVVHIEVPFGKPIEEVYDGVHSGPVLGSGISGLVRLVTHKATGIRYAVKVLDLALVETAEGLRQLREEIFIMCQLDHPNIVRLEEVYESHSEIYLVQELCVGGELFDRLDEQPDYHYTEAECARLVKQMLSAVRYLHSKGIIHRDLKLENFLFSTTATDSELKMIDFGLSKHFRFGEVHHEAVGTPYTVAPEVILGSYDERCDIWSVGVITFLLLSGDPPFGGCGGPEPLMQVRSNILNGDFDFQPAYIWANTSQLARDFIRALLVTNPRERPTARQAQKHRWLQEWASRSRDGNDNLLNPNVVKALVNFKEYSDMRKLLCEVLSFTLLPDQIKDLRREFEKIDTDGSGEISLGALKQVLMANAGAGSLGALTEEEVEDIFHAMRVRKTETRIHWHEFIAAGLSQCEVDDRNLRLAFERLDSDHKGYITLDDIMDLMGGDAIQSEEAMSRMWGDSIQAVKCQHSRITYDDFLLLMKGQTKEPPSQKLERELGSSKALLGAGELYVVPETASHPDENSHFEPGADENSHLDQDAELFSGDIVVPSSALPVSPLEMGTPYRSASPALGFLGGETRSAPNTPAGHKPILGDAEDASPALLGEDEDQDISSSGPGVPGSSASLTPPMSPARGPHDYLSPAATRHLPPQSIRSSASSNIMIPGLPPPGPLTYRSRSKSLSDKSESKASTQATDLQSFAEHVRDMLLPETDHDHSQNELSDMVKDVTKSALVVNRKLYRAHRKMRLAVLETSKRFEEQQTAHARDMILAQRASEDSGQQGSVGMIQAGLVMRHGHTKQVSSEAIRRLLAQNQKQQEELVEKANRRGGRGRRSRKKTASDMSGMLSSLGQDELGKVASRAVMLEGSGGPEAPLMELSKTIGGLSPVHSDDGDEVLPDLAALAQDVGHIRPATVPGEFIATSDPFGSQGRYGAAVSSSWTK